MKLIAIAAVAAAGVALSGCATVITGSSETVAINTPPTSGADCTLSDKEGSWSVSSPGQVQVPKSKHDISVHCSKAGWQDADATMPSGFQAWTIGNLLIGGLIGLGIDMATGAINEYPKNFDVPMTQKTAGASEPPPPSASGSPSS